MPKRILLVGLLFILGGLGAILNVVTSLIQGTININFGILLLPVGIGLLRGRYASMMWARFWCLLGMGACLLLAILALMKSENAKFIWFDQTIDGPAAVPYCLAGAAFFGALIFLVYRLLKSRQAEDYCIRGK